MTHSLAYGAFYRGSQNFICISFELLLPEEEEYYPRLSTKELAQHFEKTIEEAAPSKKIKVSLLAYISTLTHECIIL